MNKNQSVSTENQMRKKEASEWMRYAKEDYNLVQHLYRGDYYPKPLAIICYHCEQATEKATTLVDKDGRERKISKPVLEWEIMSLVSQGFTEIILTVSYRSDQIMSYFGDGSRLGCKITYFVEDTVWYRKRDKEYENKRVQ